MTYKPEISISQRLEQGEGRVVFTAIFHAYAVKELGINILDAAAKGFAEKLLEDKELVAAALDREKLTAAITDAIGRAFVERLLGKPGQ